jgi:hypothetical protein
MEMMVVLFQPFNPVAARLNGRRKSVRPTHAREMPTTAVLYE